MSHLASLSQLQTPAFASVDGVLVPYAEVRVHISAEALTRALSVFEGLKGYWDDDGSTFAIRSPRAHDERLLRSARLLHVPVDVDYPEFLRRIDDLASELLVPGRDLWFRTTLYGTEGHWGEGTRASLIITAFTQPMTAPKPMRLTVSSWRRGTDLDLPTRVKTGANYVPARLARIEAHGRGADDAILLNRDGRVAESTGSCVLVATEGGLVSPPPSEGALDSITVRTLARVCAAEGLALERRPIERSELLVADEVAVAGTISELTAVSDVDGQAFPTGGLMGEVYAAYMGVMRGRSRLDGVEMVPSAAAARARAVTDGSEDLAPVVALRA